VVNTHRMLHRPGRTSPPGAGSSGRRRRRSPAPARTQGPEGMDRRPAPGFSATRPSGSVLRALGARSHLGNAPLRTGWCPA
jgi:hypothetical protein